jgi:hypothetical protein
MIIMFIIIVATVAVAVTTAIRIIITKIYLMAAISAIAKGVTRYLMINMIIVIIVITVVFLELQEEVNTRDHYY